MAVALSGIFAVTFSIVFAYVADCTNENERSCSYGLVSGLHVDVDLHVYKHQIDS